jgi:hypothetical protein
MTGYIMPSAEMIVGALIGITTMAGVVACVCALSLSHKRKANRIETSAAAQPAVQKQAPATRDDKAPEIQADKAKKDKPVKLPKPEKAAKIKPVREKKQGGGFFSFSKKNKEKVKTETAAAPATAPVAAQPAQAAQPQQPKNAISANEKAAKQPDLKEAKASKAKVEKPPQKAEVKEDKGKGFGWFSKKRKDKESKASPPASAQAKETGSPAISGGYKPPQSDANASKPFVMPAAAQAAIASQAATAPSAPPPPQSETAPPSRPPEGIAPASPLSAPVEAEPEKKEENADSVFNLFTDTEGEESEIGKFAANFDNVSLESLLGDCQSVMKRLSKN